VDILLVFACVLALVIIDVPIAVALGIVAVVAMIITQGTGSLPNLPVVIYNGATNFPLIAIPLFILAGAIMNASGITTRLIAFASSILGFVRGGLALVSIGASLFFAEISGSAVADVSALGSILIPAMKAKGYPSPLAAAVMSSDWNRDYPREQAAFPVHSLRQDKYFPPVGRIDGAAGDRNLVCSCPPIEAFND